MIEIIRGGLLTLNELLTAGIAITAFSLLVYAFTFNLRDRVARYFAIILICVVIVFVGDTIGSTTSVPRETEFWLRFQWVGIVFLPAAYLHFSDALLDTTGRPLRGWQRFIPRITYLISLIFLITLPFRWRKSLVMTFVDIMIVIMPIMTLPCSSRSLCNLSPGETLHCCKSRVKCLTLS